MVNDGRIFIFETVKVQMVLQVISTYSTILHFGLVKDNKFCVTLNSNLCCLFYTKKHNMVKFHNSKTKCRREIIFCLYIDRIVKSETGNYRTRETGTGAGTQTLRILKRSNLSSCPPSPVRFCWFPALLC